jgi:acyl-CoA thioesterase-2
MTFALSDLLATLDLEQLELNLFRGRGHEPGWKRVFGGHVVAQALIAATRTVEGRRPHSLHGYFLLPGDPTIPIVYDVDRIRDGRSFTTRRVVAIQRGQAIFSLAASFHVEEDGLEHQIDMPATPPADSLPSAAEILERFGAGMTEPVRRWLSRERPIELRPADLGRYLSPAPQEPRQAIWIRSIGTPGDDLALHTYLLAYATDMALLGASLLAHGKSIFDPDIMPASLDHAVWFHKPARIDRWLLYVQDSPFAGGARGFTRGLVFTEAGELVASVAQEGLIRRRSGA